VLPLITHRSSPLSSPSLIPRPPRPTRFPYTTLFRSPASNAPANRSVPAGCAIVGRIAGSHRVTDLRSPTIDRGGARWREPSPLRLEEHTSELSHVKISYAVFCLKKKK